MEGTGRTDEQLAREAAREDSDGPAFQALVQRYRDQVWQICFRLMGNAEDASDAAQEVFVRLFLHRGRYQQKSKYSTWMYGVALRTCLSMRRARSRRVRRVQAAEITPEMVGQPGEANTTSLRIDLQQMLNTLNEEDRALLILKYAQGHSYDQLAEMFGLSVSACKMRVSRAREKLQQRFPEIKND